MSEKEENIILIKKVIALSGYDREKFAEAVLDMKLGTLNAKISGKHSVFNDSEIAEAWNYARKNGFWDEYGFKYETDDILLLWKRVMDFTLLPIYDIGLRLEIQQQKIYRYHRMEYDKVSADETKKILALASEHNLRAVLKFKA